MMTTTTTAPRETSAAAEARTDWFDAHMPQWREMTAPERFVSENDMPVYDRALDAPHVSNEDWEMFFGSR